MQSFRITSRVGAFAIAVVGAGAGVGLQAAIAADLPVIKVSAANPVPGCATPGRLQAYLAKRNGSLSGQFKTIAVDYMREGELLGIRWDFAFYQMMLETGNLSYTKGARINGVKPEQNNFAGLRPVEKSTYESFPDVATGVRAHLQHVSLYNGETVSEPVAQRTRRIQEMGLLAQWRKTIKHDVTYSNLAEKWTDGSDTYASRLEEIAKQFDGDYCNVPDPHPELIAAVRGDTVTSVASAEPLAQKTTSPGIDLARRAIEAGADQRSALGAGSAVGPSMPIKILNAPVVEPVPQAQVLDALPPPQSAKLPVPQLPKQKQAAQPPVMTKTAVVGAMPKAMAPVVESPAAPAPEAPAAAAQPVVSGAVVAPHKCRVYTASYGGQRAVIVKATVDHVANYTVLDVNEGQEAREAEAFISAYAKGGSVAGQFTTQTLALDKAFELCPEG